MPELPENDLPITLGPEETPQGSENSVAYLRLLWEHRRLLARVVLYGFLASTFIAFLIPTRYESTTRLMPPDSNQSGGLAMAAAALSDWRGAVTDERPRGRPCFTLITVPVRTSAACRKHLIQKGGAALSG